MFCNKDRSLYSSTQEMLLGEGLYWINICCVEKSANTAVFFSLQGCWVGRENGRFDDQLISVVHHLMYSHMCHISVAEVLLLGGILFFSLWNSYSLTQSIFKQRLTITVVYAHTVLFTSPFTFKFHSMNCLWTYFPCSYYQVIVLCTQQREGVGGECKERRYSSSFTGIK